MNEDFFAILKEIASLKAKLQTISKQSHSELQRIQKIEKMREQRQKQLETDLKIVAQAKISFQSVENKISHAQTQLQNKKAQINSTFDEKTLIQLEKDVFTLETSIDEYEDAGLVLIEDIEKRQDQINDHHSFLEGSRESLNEISMEVLGENKDLEKQSSSIQIRVNVLKDQLPTKYIPKLEKAMNLYLNPFAQISNSYCNFCSVSVPSLDERKVEVAKEFLTCPNCSKIFIPN